MDAGTLNQGGFGSVFQGHDEGTAIATHAAHHGQRTAHRPQCAGQRKLASEFIFA